MISSFEYYDSGSKWEDIGFESDEADLNGKKTISQERYESCARSV
jgi:hypothetical protein